MDCMVMARVPPAEELRRRAARLRLVLTDVDGVLTDGGVFYGSNGEVGKRFSVRDGMGVERLRGAGIETRFVTRERSAAVRARADKLGIPRIHEGVTDKRAALESILRDAEVAEHEVAYIGDDVNDLEVIVALSETGLTGAPFDAISEVALAAHFTSSSRGGHGAFRDFAEWILLLKSSEVLQ
jgi:3-deoxy-D-manno-octulosonate 8-phosphate phosphatase (KDO 8-P phosphatase)